MSKSGIFPAWGVLLIAVVLSGCEPAPMGPGPEQIAQQYYEALQREDFGAAAELYIDAVPRASVVRMLEANRERFGRLEDFRQMDLVSYVAQGGLRYTLRYSTRYANGHAMEELMLFQGRGDNTVRLEATNVHPRMR